MLRKPTNTDTLPDRLSIPLHQITIVLRCAALGGACIASLPGGLNDICYLGPRAKPNQHSVVGQCPNGRFLLSGVKFVPAIQAGTGIDEAIIGTAHFVHYKEVARMLGKGDLRPYRLVPRTKLR
jgi:hypothetical protein